MREEVGFIGVGSMGGSMVRRLLSLGFSVLAYDSSEGAIENAAKAGARRAVSPREVADSVETVLVSLPTPDVVKTVALGENGIAGGARVKTYVDLSTTGKKMAEEVAQSLAAYGIATVDAPVSGGPGPAAEGALAIMVSGAAAACAGAKHILDALGSKITLVGDQVGQGQMMKLVNNLLSATTLAAACEVCAMGRKAGISSETMLAVINSSSGRSFVSERLLPHALDGSFNFGFRTRLMHKDVRLAVQEADELGMLMLTTGAAATLWSYAMTHGLADHDFTELLRVVEKFGGEHLAAGPPA